MKKLLMLVLSAFFLGACSVDPLENKFVDSELLVLDATYSVAGCDITTFDFGDAGKIEVRNDLEFIHLKISVNGGL